MFSFGQTKKHFSEHKNQKSKSKTKGQRRTSLVTSCSGAVSLEASLVLPLFVFVFLLLIEVGEVLCIHGQIYHGLTQTAREMAVYEYGVSRGKLKHGVLQSAAAHTKFLSSVNGSFLDRSVLTGKAAAIVLTGTAKMDEQENVVIQAHYAVQIKIPFFPGFTKTYQQKIRQKAMTGYVPSGGESQEGYVYITPYESVYHKSIQCTHLALDIRQVQNVEPYLSGHTKYHPCERCTKYHTGSVTMLFVAAQGDAYHTDLGCSGLKRTVSQVKESQVKGMKPCERCGK